MTKGQFLRPKIRPFRFLQNERIFFTRAFHITHWGLGVLNRVFCCFRGPREDQLLTKGQPLRPKMRPARFLQEATYFLHACISDDIMRHSSTLEVVLWYQMPKRGPNPWANPEDQMRLHDFYRITSNCLLKKESFLNKKNIQPLSVNVSWSL